MAPSDLKRNLRDGMKTIYQRLINGIFAIRVSLSIAVSFIVDLKHREEAAFFSPREHLIVNDASGPNT